MYTLKKSLGQHFLHNEQIIDDIVAALQKHTFSRLLEVGPGAGALTRKIMHVPGIDFKAVELDQEKIDYLLQKYPDLLGKLIHDSILDVAMPFTEPFALIGNFPYNISSQILFKILEWKEYVPVAIGMFQKEVAQRAAAVPGSKDYGVLSALLQPFYEVTYLFDVGPQNFTPPPKVMSGVIQLTRKKEVPGYKNEKAYTSLIKTAFNQRRKTLRNGTRSLFLPDVLQQEIFNRRAETISIEEFAALTHLMEGFK